MSHSVLIVCHTFPPSYGIGGRRWRKFAKYLVREGYKVHVISAKPWSYNKPFGLNDINNVNVHRLSRKYPRVLDEPSQTFWGRVRFKAWVIVLRWFVHGTVYDRVIFWKKMVTRKILELVEKYDIQNIIVTGPPFRLLYYVSLLKKSHPHLNIIMDLRDPWTWSHDYGYPTLKGKDLKVEKDMESFAMKNSDYIVVPYEVLQKRILSKYPEVSEKCALLTHAFDPEEVCAQKKISSSKIRLVYYGNLYDGIEPDLKCLSSILKKHSSKVSLDIYSDSTRYFTLFKQYGLEKTVQYHEILSPKELFFLFQTFDYVMLIQPWFNKDYITTKFYEIIQTRTPIILISEKGVVSDFITKHKLGIHIVRSEIENTLNNLFLNQLSFRYNLHFDTRPYSFENITKELIKLLN